LNQIALFEGKVAGGNGEQVLSRDVYRLGQLFDFFRMLTFFSPLLVFMFAQWYSLLPCCLCTLVYFVVSEFFCSILRVYWAVPWHLLQLDNADI
jgi:hypothetical protein